MSRRKYDLNFNPRIPMMAGSWSQPGKIFGMNGKQKKKIDNKRLIVIIYRLHNRSFLSLWPFR